MWLLFLYLYPIGKYLKFSLNLSFGCECICKTPFIPPYTDRNGLLDANKL